MGRGRHRGRRLVRHGARVVAVDRSAAMVALAQKRVADRARVEHNAEEWQAAMQALCSSPNMTGQRCSRVSAQCERRQRAPKLTGSCDETDPYLSEDDAGRAARKTFSRRGDAPDNPRALPCSQNMD